jgi:uncharacterized protein (DUF58 family)
MSVNPQLVPATVSNRAFPATRWPAAFGARFYTLLIVGLAWIGPGWIDRRFLFGMVLWDALVLAAWLYDLHQMPRPGALFVSRVWSAPVSLDCNGTVTIKILNRGRVGIRASVTDDIPVQLRRTPAEIEIKATPGKEGEASYYIHPRERGDAQLAGVFVRYQTALHIAERWATVKLDQTVRVYPNLEDAKKHTIFLLRSRQVEQERRLQRRRGLGREFESLRDWRDGDELRDICWTATARRAKLITKIHRVERSQSVWIVVDAGRLLRARVGTLSKLDYAVNAALTLAHVAMFSGDKVGLLAYGRKPQQHLNAARGSAHMRDFMERLAMVKAEAVEADHFRAAQMLLRDQKRRSLIVWLTDLAETAMTPEVIDSAYQMMPRHVVLFAALAQPELAELAESAPQTVEDLYRHVAAQEMVQRRDLLLARLRSRGALALELAPGKLSTELVNHYLDIKERSLI